jgi:hypothetical protein
MGSARIDVKPYFIISSNPDRAAPNGSPGPRPAAMTATLSGFALCFFAGFLSACGVVAYLIFSDPMPNPPKPPR